MTLQTTINQNLQTLIQRHPVCEVHQELCTGKAEVMVDKTMDNLKINVSGKEKDELTALLRDVLIASSAHENPDPYNLPPAETV